ncbi:MAG: hypothetical protein KFH98_01665 [Gemmatimonadetes bacterium]|nr:hypothetical protein [Gemmatimonadota bacterium]
MSHSNVVLLRDLAIFQVKLVLDGLKDIVLMPVTIGAAAIDIVLPGSRPGHRFYLVMAAGERFDRWLNLFSASDHADASKDGLFGMGRTSRNTMLGEIEEKLFGRDRSARDGRTQSAS